ncbi:LacI family DNA-binding transcriptional regulator [Leucobacter rhizosphaerae]|uniref:LacI family DNA-binding transcriptional regulator n=1 Tax=Leucobacter rhizosphaerae TaxID=2932245 RepID=A0ABY4FTD3_9MICO|nr:LacI family DNA-binding transcriptional regulator [Leucobacter rhizosphaerae]UOQ59520.1 LacI family DNA-binding transcriptional regulator [Leucobacter rhizosphaerae]
MTRRSTNSVTLHDVAAHAGVSPQTVSRAIRMPNLVSESTLAVVRTSIAETGYVPNLAASNLASNRSMTVAALVPAVSYSVFAETIHGLDAVLASKGYHLFIGSTDYDADREEELIRAFLGRRPDGIIVVGTEHTPAARAMLAGAKVPVVETWSWTDEPIDSLVGFSNREAITAVVDYVHSRGYRHPTFAGWLTGSDSRALDRRLAFEQRTRELYPGEPIRVVDSGADGISIAAGRALLDRALREHPETDVLLCASDIFATGALLEAQSRGIAVPDRLAICGFGDFELSRHLSPALTTVSTPNLEIGRRAGELLLSRMHGETAEPTSLDLGFSLAARDSA